MGKLSKVFLELALVLVFLGGAVFISAAVDPALVAQQRARLEAELADYEKQISEYQDLIVQKQREGKSLKSEIDLLNAQISKAKIAIKARILRINKLLTGIEDKSKNIVVLEADIERSRASLSQFLRKIHENDGLSTVELALTYQNLSQFFGEVESLNDIQGELQNTFDKFNNLRIEERRAKEDLQDQKDQEVELKAIQELEQKQLQVNEKSKNKILADTKGKESEYQKILKDKAKNAANIRSQLFLLSGSPSISFEKALEYANTAERATGIRPAFLLGVITQETNLGANIGQCNLPDDPPKFKWQAIMKPARDHAPYLDITSRLGLDPNLMPLSCPQTGGWGGAMGPAQFIPSTWVLFEKRITQATGSKPPNPWNARDGFAAAALLLTDNGAGTQMYNAEWTAAMKYFAGSNWQKTAYRFYGDDVMAIAKKYQDQIDLLQSLAQN